MPLISIWFFNLSFYICSVIGLTYHIALGMTNRVYYANWSPNAFLFYLVPNP